MKKIGNKVLVMILVLASVFVVNGVMSIYTQGMIKSSGAMITDCYLTMEQEVYEMQKSIERAQKYLNIISLYDNAELRAGLEEALSGEYASIELHKNNVNGYLKIAKNKRLDDAYETYMAYVDQALNLMVEIQACVDRGDFMGASLKLSSEFQGLVEETGEPTETEFMDALSQAVADASEDYNRAVTISAGMTIIVFAAFLVCVAIMMIVITRTVSKPANDASRQLNQIISDINQNQGDLTNRISIKSKDEIGQLSHGINNFISNLQLIMQKIKAESDLMDVSISSMNEEITKSNDNVVSFSSVMQQLTASMEQIAATVEQMNGNTQEILQDVNEVKKEIENGTEISSDIKALAVGVKDLTEDKKNGIEAVIIEKEESLQKSIEQSKQVEEINHLTDDILEIASQTNLLALNASIEAARAGEAGKGFAVVAEEIRVLAENSRNTANDIQVISTNVVGAVESLMNNANDVIGYIQDTVMEDYKGFEGATDLYLEKASHMDTVMNSCNESISNLQNTMSEMASGISNIASAMSESTDGISTATENVSALANSIAEIKEDAKSNMAVSDKLLSEVNRFQKI